MGDGGREGDWECGGCRNRNYAFRSLCNRCKRPRLLVDTKTPADSKWLPRLGDWICSGCSNNNYASRDKCKKCGQPKEEAAMPAIPLPGSLETYAQYLSKLQGVHRLKMNCMMTDHSVQQSLQQNCSYPAGISDRFEFQSSPWPSNGDCIGSFPYAGSKFHSFMVPKSWRNGDWICNCGFHNYSSREQCKKCNAGMPPREHLPSVNSGIFPSLGTKRVASDEFLNSFDNKRLNAGGVSHDIWDTEHCGGFRMDLTPGMFSKYGNSGSPHPKGSQIAAVPILVGKGAKEWRDGDWLCKSCNNHNFASRSHCNRCKTEKGAAVLPVSTCSSPCQHFVA